MNPDPSEVSWTSREWLESVFGVPSILFISWGFYWISFPLHHHGYRDNTNWVYVLMGLAVLVIGAAFAATAISLVQTIGSNRLINDAEN